MRLQAFLSHKRERQRPVIALRDDLRVLGIGGWKDTADLGLGAPTENVIREVIANGTGGFIWWATRDTLESRVITRVELPAALRRKRREPSYPLVPVFVELDPRNPKDRASLAARLGRWPLGNRRAKRLLDLNGVPRKPGEPQKDLVARAADRYARDAIRGVGKRDITASFNVAREPRPDQDLSFDWRPAFDIDRRGFRGGGLARIRDALGITRAALQAEAGQPRVTASFDTPLPLACLVGFEWRIATGICLDILQRTGTTEYVIDGAGEADRPLEVPPIPNGPNPVVIAVSATWAIPEAARRYATALDACLVEMHVPGTLTPSQIRGLAHAVIDVLKVVNDRGVEKHLLIRGPEALAALIGAGANATGSTVVPFWHNDGYVNPIRIR